MRHAVTALLLVACGSAPQRVGTQPSWRHAGSADTPPAPTPQLAVFAPSSEPATRYNEPLQPPPHTPIGDAVTAAIQSAASQAHMPAPLADARLFRASAELAELLPEEDTLDPRAIDFALRREGIIEASQNLRTAWADLSNVDEVAKAFASSFPDLVGDYGGQVRFGVGAVARGSSKQGAIVFVVVGSELTTSPIPRQLPAHGSFLLEGALDPRFHEPEIFVTYDDNRVERLAPQIAKTGAFRLGFSCGKHAGAEHLEIGATGARGWTTLANFPVWCAAEPPATLALTPPEPPFEGSADEAEQELFARVNVERRAAGLSPVQWDPRVAKVARAYSEEMARTKIVAHVSPTSGSHGDRLRAAGIITGDSLETVARGYGIANVHAGLMDSPAHRAALLHPRATHIGIGVAIADEGARRRTMYATHLLIRIAPVVEPRKVAEIVYQRMNALHHVVVNAQMASIAQTVAEGLAAGKTSEAMWPIVKKRLDALGDQYGHFTSLTVTVDNIDDIDGKALVGDYSPDAIGVGVAQGPHPEYGERAIWILVLVAEHAKK